MLRGYEQVAAIEGQIGENDPMLWLFSIVGYNCARDKTAIKETGNYTQVFIKFSKESKKERARILTEQAEIESLGGEE